MSCVLWLQGSAAARAAQDAQAERQQAHADASPTGHDKRYVARPIMCLTNVTDLATGAICLCALICQCPFRAPQN